MDKRGQVTIFIIIALIVVGLVIIFFVFYKPFVEEKLYSPEVKQVSDFVYWCIDKESNETIYHVANGGGYYFPITHNVTTSGIIIYSNEDLTLPTKLQIQEEISYYFSKRLFLCTSNFTNFPELEIKQEEIKTETIIEEDSVTLNIEYPLTITKANSSSIIKNFNNFKIPVRLGIVHNAAAEIMQNQVGFEGICLSCLLNIGEKYNLNISMVGYSNEIVIFTIRDENSKINNGPLSFIFADKYQ